MKIHRKSGMVSGKGEETMVFYSWRGKQFARRLAKPYTRKNTARWIRLKATFSELAALWRELPESIRTLWEHYAAKQGSAYDVEKNEAVTYRYCPFSSYPPRPKLMSGQNAFVGANIKAAFAGLEIPRLYPPLDVVPPPAPRMDVWYDHRTKELVVELDAPARRAFDQRKATIWITIKYKSSYIAFRSLLGSIDLPGGAQKTEARFKGLYNSRPIKFGKFDYLRIYVGAQILETLDKNTTPLVSAGAIQPYYILNERRYLPLEDLVQAGQFRNIGSIRFSRHFYKRLRQRHAQIGTKKIVKIMSD